MLKRIGIVLVLLAATLVAAAKPPRTQTVVRTWTMPNYSAIADTIPFKDTTMLNYFDIDIQHRYSTSSAMNGNVLVSPIESRIVQERLETIDDPFAWSLAPYVVTPQQQRYFNTTTPYSAVAYKKGFTDESDISVLFTGNIGKRTNLGLDMEYLKSIGHYANTAGKLFRGSIWGSYTGENYSMHGAFSWSRVSSYDNGGLVDIEDLRGKLGTMDLPTRLPYGGMVGYRYLSGYLHNQYSLTTEREYHDSIEVVEDGKRVKRDTIRTESIPLMTFSHIFETNDSYRRYIETTPNQGFYDTTYYNVPQTADTTDVLTIRNTIAVTFCEAYNTKLKFGATVFAMNECQRILYDSVRYDSIHDYRWMNNTYVGGSIHKRSGAHILYMVEGKVCVVGYKIGEFDVHGELETKFNIGGNTMHINARALIKSITPSPYLQHYTSNHLKWDNHFGFSYRLLGGASISYPTKWVTPSIDFSFENRANPIFVTASDWMPHQYGGSVQIMTGDIGLDITTPWVNLENRIIIQHTTNDSVLPVPLVTLQNRLYYHGSWFRRAMDAQIGVDLRYFTRYKAPVLCPATGMFATQQQTGVGNYPWMSVYASFYVHSIRLRFFVQYQHLNHLFMSNNIDYIAMPNYPTNRDIIRAGVAWHFYN